MGDLMRTKSFQKWKAEKFPGGEVGDREAFKVFRKLYKANRAKSREVAKERGAELLAEAEEGDAPESPPSEAAAAAAPEGGGPTPEQEAGPPPAAPQQAEKPKGVPPVNKSGDKDPNAGTTRQPVPSLVSAMKKAARTRTQKQFGGAASPKLSEAFRSQFGIGGQATFGPQIVDEDDEDEDEEED